MIASAGRRSSTAAATRRRRRAPLAIALRISCASAGAHALVGIDRQHPIAGRQRQRKSLLRAEALRTDATPRARPCPARSAPCRRCCRCRPRCARRRTKACRGTPRCCRPRSCAMMMALSRGMLASRPPVGVEPPHPAPGIAHACGTAAPDNTCGGFPSGRDADTGSASPAGTYQPLLPSAADQAIAASLQIAVRRADCRRGPRPGSAAAASARNRSRAALRSRGPRRRSRADRSAPAPRPLRGCSSSVRVGTMMT